MKVKEMSTTSRPREKALAIGLSALTDYELIAIILRTGYQGKSVIQLAQEVLKIFPLDKLNNVVISPTEPTTGEEVWIKKGKNLFNKSNFDWMWCYT